MLVPAFIAGLLAQSTDRSPWLMAILADRYRRPAIVLIAAAAAIAVGNSVAAFAGTLIAPTLNPEARTLMLALALLFAGGGALLPVREPDRLSGWRIGSVATTFLGIIILAFGDAAQFLVLGLTAQQPGSVHAAIGATAGCMVALLAPVSIGEQAWLRLPLRPLRWTIAVLFLLAGAITLLSAFRII
ncbi:TMEM165/GDT1 family protein [Sphingomonas japonica]|uniref:GDT1 family protein n=1 Tax=Sphingomonas japonica TaxID=511662 RepID=A0ABX0U2S1_9SPHN|nr:TMEM165/GDT1 family protein [Sphingomonas japonica]NIJ24019.1 putative Ca2+/H+ antiporter (TMEM165/GDT1 family) [Sphingomonas japonica]